MSRPVKNQLTIQTLPGGWFFLTGRINGQQIRRKNQDLAALEKLKTELETDSVRIAAAEATRPIQQYTRLNFSQIKQAEAVFDRYPALPRSLLEYIQAGLGVLGTGELVKIADAAKVWEDNLTIEKKLKGQSISRNLQYLNLYIREFKPTYVTDITMKNAIAFCSLTKIEAMDDARGPSIHSAINRKQVLRAFMSFCVRREYIASNPLAKLSLTEDVKLAKKRAKDPSVFTAAQCKALLDAALEHEPRFVPFVILATWCFARQEEVDRLTPEHVRLDVKVPYVQLAGHKLGTANKRNTTIPANVLPLLRECIETGLWAKGTAPFMATNAFRMLREKAGLLTLAEPDAKGNRKIVTSLWEQNVLRHTGISMLYKKYSDMADGGLFKEAASISAAVTRQAGNSKDVMFAHYLKDVSSEEAAAFFAVTGKLKPRADISIAQCNAQAVA